MKLNSIIIMVIVILAFYLIVLVNNKKENTSENFSGHSKSDEMATSTPGEVDTSTPSEVDTSTPGGESNSTSNQVSNGMTPIQDNINLHVNVVKIAKDYNGIYVSFKKKQLNNIKYYLHVYRLDDKGNELSGEGSYLLVGLDPIEDKEISERLITSAIPIKHPKAKKYIVALQYTYTNENGKTIKSDYQFPTNLSNENKIFTLNRQIEDQVADYKKFEAYLEKKQEIEKDKLKEEAQKIELISNADGTFNTEQLKKSLGGFPDSLFLDKKSISSLDELINRNLKLGILNVNAHIAENVYQDPNNETSGNNEPAGNNELGANELGGNN